MIPTPSQVWLVVEPIDMRAGIDGLSQRIQNTLGRSPCERRLHRGRFTWPTANATTFSLTPAQWGWLTAGVDWQRLSAAAPAHWQV